MTKLVDSEGVVKNKRIPDCSFSLANIILWEWVHKRFSVTFRAGDNWHNQLRLAYLSSSLTHWPPTGSSNSHFAIPSKRKGLVSILEKQQILGSSHSPLWWVTVPYICLPRKSIALLNAPKLISYSPYLVCNGWKASLPDYLLCNKEAMSF